ncbi:MAG: hypothetical protein LQ341_006694 [Variospora aurantia]|nr:MAG: hypothetical protein LQ341_006694 [Variospora aurantia]
MCHQDPAEFARQSIHASGLNPLRVATSGLVVFLFPATGERKENGNDRYGSASFQLNQQKARKRAPGLKDNDMYERVTSAHSSVSTDSKHYPEPQQQHQMGMCRAYEDQEHASVSEYRFEDLELQQRIVNLPNNLPNMGPRTRHGCKYSSATLGHSSRKITI